ncbi:MAG: hypothetical protein FWH43_03510 [Endomicrobia bacterium]|nr:hypothetical protein [Endomicrobiia bacterium]
MKKIALLCLFVGLFSCVGCGGSSGGGKRSPVQEDKVSIATNMTYVSEYTYSISTPPAFAGSIAFSVGVSKDGSSVTTHYGDITWTITGDNVGTLSPVSGTSGAELILNNTTGTAIVKATYLDGDPIDEMSATVTIKVVP